MSEEEMLMEMGTVNTGSDSEYPISDKLTGTLDVQSENVTNSHADNYEYPCLFKSKSLLELSNSSWSSSEKLKDIQTYLRGCKWSPDGTCCLTVVNNDGIHVTELSRDLYSGSITRNRMFNILDSVIHVKEAGLIYDFCWYPGMNSSIPETCCWLTTRQNGPVQMWDAFDGSLRCTYRGFNAVDEMEPALAVTFTSKGSRIVAGYKKVLRTFDVQRPGREFVEHKTSSPATCFATHDNLLAVGSWNSVISLYNINETGTYKSIGKMHGHERGVTHIKFAPDGLRLISGARKDHRLLIWDIRYYRKPLQILHRVADTNQRIYFDISPCGKYLVSGGTDGVVKVWNRELEDDNPMCKFKLHNDCCNSISIHPYRPILATGSGQYHFKDPIKPLEELSSSDQVINTNLFSDDQRMECDEVDLFVRGAINSDNEKNRLYNSDVASGKNGDMKYSSVSENSLVFWWMGDIDLT